MQHQPQSDEALSPEFCAAVEALHVELHRVRRMALAEAGLHPEAEPGSEFAISWSAGSESEDLAEQMFEQARKAASEVGVVRPGCVWCYRCGSAACEHAAPSAPGCVFLGYANNGAPIWQEFLSALLTLEDDRVDRLYGDAPRTLARVIGRKTLISEQTLAYGRNSFTYRIVGQVIAGYIKVRGQDHALTAQVVETSDRNLHAQVLMADPLREAIADAPAGEGAFLHRLHAELQELRQTVASVANSWRGARTRPQRKELEQQLFGAFRRLVGSIERRGRQRHRRSQHAETRSQQQRPVHRALEDLRQAPTEAFYRDNKTQSIVVVGRRGRSHVFNDAGRHITSLVLPGDQLERRIHRRRYTPLPKTDAESLRNTIATQLEDR